jgi:hypothetical protein
MKLGGRKARGEGTTEEDHGFNFVDGRVDNGLDCHFPCHVLKKMAHGGERYSFDERRKPSFSNAFRCPFLKAAR